MATPLTVLKDNTNDAEEAISFQEPYVFEAAVVGVAPFLFHRWSVEAIEEKAKAAKGSKAKKEDDIESYVYRDTKGLLGIPVEYFRQACILASKYKQDPRSPRKSMMDLMKASITAADQEICLFTPHTKNWDFLDRRRVVVQRSGITRTRPAMNTGWKVTLRMMVLSPEYVDVQLANEILQSSGRLCGVGDFRPSYGRFQVVGFKKVI